MSYQIVLPRSVQKELDRLADEVTNRVLLRLSELESNPRPPDVKKLKGREAWRIRVGDYRVIYEIHDPDLQVLSRWVTGGKSTVSSPRQPAGRLFVLRILGKEPGACLKVVPGIASHSSL